MGEGSSVPYSRGLLAKARRCPTSLLNLPSQTPSSQYGLRTRSGRGPQPTLSDSLGIMSSGVGEHSKGSPAMVHSPASAP